MLLPDLPLQLTVFSYHYCQVSTITIARALQTIALTLLPDLCYHIFARYLLTLLPVIS